MVRRRRRFKQTTTLAQRLTEEASRLREQARRLSPGPEQAQLWRKVRQAETALRIEAWLALSHDGPPGEVVPFMEENHGKRRKPARETTHRDDAPRADDAFSGGLSLPEETEAAALHPPSGKSHFLRST